MSTGIFILGAKAVNFQDKEEEINFNIKILTTICEYDICYSQNKLSNMGFI